jgi:hypothetical protein
MCGSSAKKGGSDIHAWPSQYNLDSGLPHLPRILKLPSSPFYCYPQYSFIRTRTNFSFILFYPYLHQLYFNSLPLQSSNFPQSHPRLSTTRCQDNISTQKFLTTNFQCLNQSLNPGRALKPTLKVTGTHSKLTFVNSSMWLIIAVMILYPSLTSSSDL